MPPTLFGTGAKSAIAGGIRIIIRYGISWICSVKGHGDEKETDTGRKLQVIEDEEL